MKHSFLVRRRFFDSYGNHDTEFSAALPPRGVRFTCPCCGYPTLGAREQYEVCRLCSWEDEGQDDKDEEARSTTNHEFSLNEARGNFEEYLVMYPPAEDPRMGGPDDEATNQVKSGMIAAFDEMVQEPTAERLNELWAVIRKSERELDRLLKVKLAQYL